MKTSQERALFSRRNFIAASGVTIAATALAACSPAPSDSNGTASGQASAPTQAAAPSTSTEFYTNLPTAHWDKVAQNGANAAASRAFKAFTAKASSQQTWWNQYGVLLTDSYRNEAFYIDYTRITLTSFKNLTLINPDTNPLTAIARFVTNQGVWDMVMHRTGDGQQWLVASFSQVEK